MHCTVLTHAGRTEAGLKHTMLKQFMAHARISMHWEVACTGNQHALGASACIGHQHALGCGNGYLRPYGVHNKSGCFSSFSCWPSSGLEGSSSTISNGNKLTYLQNQSRIVHDMHE